MGCICAKQSNVHDFVPENEKYVKIREVRTTSSANAKHNGKTRVVERPKSGPQGYSTSIGARVAHAAKAEQVAAGWPSWLASVAGEAVHGWTPRSPDSYQKLNKVCPFYSTSPSSHLCFSFYYVLYDLIIFFNYKELQVNVTH